MVRLEAEAERTTRSGVARCRPAKDTTRARTCWSPSKPNERRLVVVMSLLVRMQRKWFIFVSSEFTWLIFRLLGILTWCKSDFNHPPNWLQWINSWDEYIVKGSTTHMRTDITKKCSQLQISSTSRLCCTLHCNCLNSPIGILALLPWYPFNKLSLT